MQRGTRSCAADRRETVRLELGALIKYGLTKVPAPFSTSHSNPPNQGSENLGLATLIRFLACVTSSSVVAVPPWLSR
jgi:hypothetical protein